jgi:hypothetical protein
MIANALLPSRLLRLLNYLQLGIVLMTIRIALALTVAEVHERLAQEAK